MKMKTIRLRGGAGSFAPPPQDLLLVNLDFDANVNGNPLKSNSI